MYVTERCVFRLSEDGLELIEIAPGIDIENDILRLMDFRPKLCPFIKKMDKRIFKEVPMSLREDLLSAHRLLRLHLN